MTAMGRKRTLGLRQLCGKADIPLIQRARLYDERSNMSGDRSPSVLTSLMRTEAAGGVLLMATAAIALLIAK